jgi:hypothetical protein
MLRKLVLPLGGAMALVLAVAGCSSNKITPLPGATTAAPDGSACAAVCAPGATQLCFCPDTSRRGQTCDPSGRFWQPCPCSAAAVDASPDH